MDDTIQDELAIIQRLVGPIEREQLSHVDYFVGKEIVVFMPVTVPFYYAILSRQTCPSYMFTLVFNDQTALMSDGYLDPSILGKIVALSPEVIRCDMFLSQPLKFITIFIDKKFFEEQLLQYPLSRNVFFRGKAYDYLPALPSRLSEFMLEVKYKLPGFATIVQALSIELSHLIIRSIFHFEYKNEIKSFRSEIDKTIEYMLANLYRKVTIEKLARIAHMSPTYYAKVFKKETGQTPMNYLYQLRMERVKKLLNEGKKLVTEIALECGFNSSAYLSTCFYKTFKMTPSDYKNSFEKGRISK